MYLRVGDAQAVYDDLRAQLEHDGCLFLAPETGLTPELATMLRGREDAATSWSACTRSPTSRGGRASSR